MDPEPDAENGPRTRKQRAPGGAGLAAAKAGAGVPISGRGLGPLAVTARTPADLHGMVPTDLLGLIRRGLGAARPAPGELRIGPFPAAITGRIRHLFPASLRPAAVLVPIVDRPEGPTVLLTYRAPGLKHHGGQISFPGGGLEPCDEDPEACALRETEEEIGLGREFVEVLGRLPDHLIVTGYQVTPVVGLVRPGFDLRLDATEVADTFEAPLRHLFDVRTHTRVLRRFGQEELEAFDLPWRGHNIWGATAGMLLTLRELLLES